MIVIIIIRYINITSIALLPQPIICPVPMYATEVGISPHCKIQINSIKGSICSIAIRHQQQICIYLQHNILGHTANGIHINAFIVIAQQQLHAIGIWQCHNTMRYDWSLCLIDRLLLYKLIRIHYHIHQP